MAIGQMRELYVTIKQTLRRTWQAFMRYKFSSHKTGFSLLEIAIVLMISGLVFGTSLSLYRPIQTAQSNAMTKLKIERVMNAISTYALQQNALPCPGLPDAISPNTPGTAPPSCSSGANNAAWGIIPYITLGLTQPDVIDGAGHYMTYIVPKILTSPAGNASTDGQMTGIFKGNVASNFCGNASLSADKMLSVSRPDQDIVEPNIAVAIIAYGSDGFGAYNLNVTDPQLRRCPLGMSNCKIPLEDQCHQDSGAPSLPLGRSSHERDNAVDHADCPDNNRVYISAFSNQNGTRHFDDQILYATGSGLISRLGMAGCSP